MILSRLEAILNRNLAASRKARALCKALDGKAMTLDVVGTPVTMHFAVEGERIVLASRRDGPADARIAGTPIALLALTGAQATEGLRSGSVSIEGDAEVAQGFQKLLEQTQPEFEEELSRLIGDVAAHRVASFARGMFAWGQRSAGSFAANVAEYLQEEGRDVPTRLEVEEFLGGVDRLRDDVGRLEARLVKLEARGAAKPAGARPAAAAPAKPKRAPRR